jgi:hypothetical protein
MNGPPALAGVSRRAKDEAAAAKLFEVSESLTGVSLSGIARASFRAAS